MKHCPTILVLLLAGLSALLIPRTYGQEALAVIVNRSNPVDNMTLEDLRKYCIGERRHWSADKRVTVALRDPGQAEREAVLQLVYGMSEDDFTRYFLQREFVGEARSVPKRLSTGSGVRRFVFNVPGAIGFVRAGEVDDTVKLLHVNGYAPGDPRYPLRFQSP